MITERQIHNTQREIAIGCVGLIMGVAIVAAAAWWLANYTWGAL